MKVLVFWLAQLVIQAALQYFYHPSLVLAAIGLALMLALIAIASWSATRASRGARGLVLSLIVAGVAGFMFSQAMDIAYSFLAAPEGLRFVVLVESAASALLILASALLARTLFPRPEIEEQTQTH